MTFDLPTISALVQRLAAKLVPEWSVTCELAPSVEENHGALAMVWPTPERQMAKVVVAPHPPGESIEESVAHELTHALLSPLTALIEWSPAAVMLEEHIVERLGKLLAGAPTGLARAVSAALGNPRTHSTAVRKRIAALARGRLGKGKTRMLSAETLQKALDALESGDPEATKAILKEVIAAMATGGGESESPPAREEEPDQSKAPPMREEDVPEQMRAQYRMMKRMGAEMLRDTIAMRLHRARTVDGLALDEATIADLTKAATVEQFDREFGLVKRIATKGSEQRRGRSGVTPSEAANNGAPSLAALLEEGMAEPLARSIHKAYDNGKEDGDIALENARKRLPKKAGA